MKTYDFKFYRFGDKKPPDGSTIMFIDEEMFYGSYEFKVGEVEYMWEEYDENDKPTGCLFHEIDDPENPPPTLKLVITLNGRDIEDSMLWAPCKEIEAVLEARDKAEKALDSRRKDE